MGEAGEEIVKDKFTLQKMIMSCQEIFTYSLK